MLLLVLLFTNFLLINAGKNNNGSLKIPHISITRKYYDYNGIIQFINTLKESHPGKISTTKLTRSYEEVSIPLVKVGFRKEENVGKDIILIDAGTHAREWMTVAVALYIIKELVKNEENEYMLYNFDWYIIPLVNPDGYHFSMHGNRMWRKNMAPGKNCDGVDLNRNFGYHWGGAGASKKECLENYAGPKPFSEPETQAIRDLVLANKGRIKLYVSLHTYGELIVYPWGYKDKPVSPEFEEMHYELGNLVANAINQVRGSNYKTGRQSSILYLAAGLSIDWVSAVGEVPYSYIIEMNTNKWKFTPPPSEILPTDQEIFEGFREFHRFIERKYKYHPGTTEYLNTSTTPNGQDWVRGPLHRRLRHG